MTKTKNEKKEPKDLMPIETTQALTLQEDPDKQVASAMKAAKALMKIVAAKKNKVIIGGKQYVQFEDWQTVASFYGVTPGIEWTKAITREADQEKASPFRTYGYEARALAYYRDRIISAAEAMCTRDEANWSNKPEFMLRSMAQTRASAKALRNLFSRVVVLAGMEPTPAEEVEGLVEIKTAARVERTSKRDHEKEIQAQKMAITNLLYRATGVKPADGLAVMRAKIKEVTKLDLLPGNYPEIINRLEVSLKE